MLVVCFFAAASKRRATQDTGVRLKKETEMGNEIQDESEAGK